MTTVYTRGYYQALRILKAKYVIRTSAREGGNTMKHPHPGNMRSCPLCGWQWDEIDPNLAPDEVTKTNNSAGSALP